MDIDFIEAGSGFEMTGESRVSNAKVTQQLWNSGMPRCPSLLKCTKAQSRGRRLRITLYLLAMVRSDLATKIRVYGHKEMGATGKPSLQTCLQLPMGYCLWPERNEEEVMHGV